MKVYRVVGRTGDGFESSWSWTAKCFIDEERAKSLACAFNDFIQKVFERSNKVRVIWRYYETEEHLKEEWERYWKGNYSFEEYKSYMAERNNEYLKGTFKEKCFERFIKPVDPKYDFDSIGFLRYDTEEIEVEE